MRLAVRGEPPCDVRLARAAVREALKPFGLAADARVALAFVDDAEMRRLNARHRGKDRTTDVLSFGQRLPAGAKGADAAAALSRDVDGALDVGDILVSAKVAARQAKRRGHPLAREVAFLAAHGALHLLGFEDDTRAGYREMLGLGEDAVRRAAGH
ncbi:MAG TPA: rRNA maturation RNase YbeY [Candidatus Limnocylindria bacterium]|nr:rRNA maturation RNase YbeY [Candidatus Limnocylindria bacterium]